MSKYTFLFSGQGAQTPGMIRDICERFPGAKKIINDISDITGENTEDLLWNTDSADLSRSDKSQLAITAVSQAILAVLREQNIVPSAVAGFSLGEFSAFYASGVLDFSTMIKIVQQRGKIMQSCCEHILAESASANAPGMAAVLKLDNEKIKEILAPHIESGIVFLANMNSPLQTVIAGTAEGLSIAEELCKQAGAKRVVRLAVAGPFHSPLMQRAADEFAGVLDTVNFADPIIPVFSNVTGKRIKTGDEAKKNALLHITHPVLWSDEEKNLASLIDDGEDWKLAEIGPGATLCGLWRDSGFAYSPNNESGKVCCPTGKIEELLAFIENV